MVAGSGISGRVVIVSASLPSPLAEKVDRMSASSFETGEGCVSAEITLIRLAFGKAPSPTRGEGKEGRKRLRHSVGWAERKRAHHFARSDRWRARRVAPCPPDSCVPRTQRSALA